ncbi:MAG: hypothetical protein HC793_05230 [Aquincola sp.]|nr:hypothetical protein [Aquincola sp.]
MADHLDLSAVFGDRDEDRRWHQAELRVRPAQQGFGADREFKYARAETLTDIQLGYEIQSGFAKGLNFLLQINNANNEPYREYDSGSNLDTKLDEFGRTILFGVSYKF